MNWKLKVFRGLVFGCFCLVALVNVSLAEISADELAKIEAAVPDKAPTYCREHRKLLVFYRCEGFVHSSIPYVNKAIEIMGEKTGAFEAVFSDDMAVFEPESLKKFDAVLFNNTTRLKFEDEALRKSLMDFVKRGKGIVGIHAATDNFYNWPEAAEMMGGLFVSHPWTADGTWAVKVNDPDSGVNKSFGGQGFKINDEIYLIKPVKLYKNCRVLLSLDMADAATATADPSVGSNPVSWVRNFGGGRVFYCSLGHNHHISWNGAVLGHYLAGLQFALGDLEIDTSTIGANFELLDNSLAKAAVYDYDKSRAWFSNLEGFIHDAQGKPFVLHLAEMAIMKFLQSDATLAGKQLVCHSLSGFGNGRSAGVLGQMLVEAKTSDMARYALERMPGEGVDKVLRAGLEKTSGKEKVGIINTIGVRGDARALDVLGVLIYDGDLQIAEAAVTAVGKIGTEKSVEVLSQAREKTSRALRRSVCDALLDCAGQFVAEDEKEPALVICEQLYDSDEATVIRGAAMRGIAAVDEVKGAELIRDVLKGSDTGLQGYVVMLVREMGSERIVDVVAEQFEQFSVDGKVQMISALAQGGGKSVLPVMVDAAKSSEVEVRMAALNAMGDVGDSSVVELLAKTVAETEGAEQKQGRDSLYRLRGGDVDAAILSGIEKARPAVKAELIRAISKRNISGAESVLLQTARDDNGEVRVESLKTLKGVAEPKYLPELVVLLVNAGDAKERGEAERMVAAVANKIADRNSRGKAILDVLIATGDSEVKRSLINVLGQIGDDNALDVLGGFLISGDDKLREAAIRAVSNWPSSAPAAELKKVAENSENSLHQVLAIRGYIRLIGLEKDMGDGEIVEAYTDAMNLAKNTDDKKIVLSGLSSAKSIGALEVAAGYLDDGELQQEAEVAVVKIAASIYGQNAERCGELLTGLVKDSQNESVIKQAKEILAAIEEFDGYITDWEMAGPYTKENAGSKGLFDIEFGPESDVDSVTWSQVSTGTNKEKLWLLEFDRILGGVNRVIYVRKKIISDKDQQGRLEIGSDDGVKVWFNGEVVHANNVDRGCAPGQDKVEVALKEGVNELMLKVTQGAGEWSVCARVRGVDGGKIEGISYELK